MIARDSRSAGVVPGKPEIEQRWDPERYRRNASFVPALGTGVVELLAPQAGECILDLGCGDGTLTASLAAHASVIGVDQSAEQVAAAVARGLDARIVDGGNLPFAAEFDAVFSNAALHWMRAPDLVIDGVWRALKPGGRFVAECGGAGNVAQVLAAVFAALARRGIDGRPAIPWYFPTVDDYRARLEKRGFVVRAITLTPRPTPLPGALGDWLETFAEGFLALVPSAERAAMKAEIEDRARPILFRDGSWTVDYVRLRFAAIKPGDAKRNSEAV
ncbi:MAG: class I SAM-dependent methyltransferase [Stellaceae bacterium]